MLLWNQVDALQKHFKKDHVHMRIWTRFYGICHWKFNQNVYLKKINYTHFIWRVITWMNECEKPWCLCMHGVSLL